MNFMFKSLTTSMRPSVRQMARTSLNKDYSGLATTMLRTANTKILQDIARRRIDATFRHACVRPSNTRHTERGVHDGITCQNGHVGCTGKSNSCVRACDKHV